MGNPCAASVLPLCWLTRQQLSCTMPGPLAARLQNGTLVIPTNRWFFVNRIVVNGSVTGGNGVTYYAVFYYDFTRWAHLVAGGRGAQ